MHYIETLGIIYVIVNFYICYIFNQYKAIPYNLENIFNAERYADKVQSNQEIENIFHVSIQL